ncbi:anti-mullerian hormone [Sarotherodon galilaeus]
MRATVIDHVIVHGMTMAEAGLRVRPNLSRFTVATIIRAFRQHNRVERMPHRGGRVAIFTAAQETLIVGMVRGNNLIRLREIRDKVIADKVNFESIDDVSLATIDRVLRRQKTRMKQVYRVPFERNSARHKDLRYEGYYSWTRWPDLMSTSSWMRLASTCRNEGKEAVTSLAKEPSLRSLANGGVILLFELKDILLDRQQHHPGPAHHIYVIIWDNVRFQRTNQIREWFTTNSDHFLNVCLPPYSPFLNPIEEFLSSWTWKVYDRQPYTRENLLRAMQLACVDIPAEAFQGWIRHSRAFFPRCLARDNIACDVDEVMWPDAAQRHDAAQ